MGNRTSTIVKQWKSSDMFLSFENIYSNSSFEWNPCSNQIFIFCSSLSKALSMERRSGDFKSINVIFDRSFFGLAQWQTDLIPRRSSDDFRWIHIYWKWNRTKTVKETAPRSDVYDCMAFLQSQCACGHMNYLVYSLLMYILSLVRRCTHNLEVDTECGECE